MDEIVITDVGMAEVMAAPAEAEVIMGGTDAEVLFVGELGPQGPPGIGIPAGGEPGQFLRKASDDDYQAEWVSTDGADAHFQQDFQPATLITVTHNLGKR